MSKEEIVEYFFKVTIRHLINGQYDSYETIARNRFEATNDVLAYVEDCEVIGVECLGEARSEDE